jgi:hypothetical protein
MDMWLDVREAPASRRDDVDVVAKFAKLTGESGNRDHDAIDDGAVTLGEECDSHG